MRTQTTRAIGGRVNADGTLITGEFSSRKTATGIYVLTFPPNVRLISAVASTGNNPTVNATSVYTGNTVQVTVTNMAQAAVDQAFNVVAVVTA